MPHVVEFIGSLSRHAERLIRTSPRFSPAALELFRSYSRQQAQCAIKRIKALEARVGDIENESQAQDFWNEVLDDCHEILTAEMLARVWCAILEARDHVQDRVEGKFVARYVLLQHLEVRRRLLTFLNQWCETAYLQVAEIDGLRRKMERWTDILLGSLLREYPVQEYAFDAERAAEFTFAGLLASSTNKGTTPWARQLILCGLKRAFKRPYPTPSFLSVYQSGIVRVILGCLPNDSSFSTQKHELGLLWAAAETNAPLANVAPAASPVLLKTAPTVDASLDRYLRIDPSKKGLHPHWN